MEYKDELEQAKFHSKKNKTFLNQLKKQKPKNLDDQVHTLHNEVFEEIDCLSCANCCKTTSPIFQIGDIDRVAKSLRMKVPAFIAEYLVRDDDYDYVLKSAPCPFLADDNTCIVYDSRPTACREYPHTNRKRMYQVLDLAYRNSLICPAVSKIVSRMQSH